MGPCFEPFVEIITTEGPSETSYGQKCLYISESVISFLKLVKIKWTVGAGQSPRSRVHERRDIANESKVKFWIPPGAVKFECPEASFLTEILRKV